MSASLHGTDAKQPTGLLAVSVSHFYITYSMLLSLPAMYHTFLFSPPDRHRPMLQGKIQQLVNLNALRSAIVLQIAPAFFPALLPGQIFFQPFGLFLPANRQQKSQ